jgi:hypothetical protein
MSKIVATILLSGLMATVVSAQAPQPTTATPVPSRDPATHESFASTPTPPAPDVKLSYTETVAAHAISADITSLTNEVQTFEADISKSHPGYAFNFQTGQLVKVPVPTAPTKTPNQQAPTKK